MSRRIIVALLVIIVALLVPCRAVVADEPPPAKPVVPVFTLTGPLTETPADETLPFFGPPVTSLRDVTGRMTKAAQDKNV